MNRWTQVSDRGFDGYALFKCECGTIKRVYARNVLIGTSKSCGCWNYEQIKRKHNFCTDENGKITPEYNSYNAARNRCTNPDNNRFQWYGGRGIEFRFNSFTEFLDHVGRKPTSKHSIDRIDANGHYEIGNVRWANSHDQRVNRAK